MSSRVPAFLLGGINKTYNFLGTRTVKTAGYGVMETLVKTAPVVLIFGAATYSTTAGARSLDTVLESEAG